MDQCWRKWQGKRKGEGFQGKWKCFLQGLQCFKAQIRLCFKGMHIETAECDYMTIEHPGSSLLFLSPLDAWSESQQCLEPQLWSQNREPKVGGTGPSLSKAAQGTEITAAALS